MAKSTWFLLVSLLVVSAAAATQTTELHIRLRPSMTTPGLACIALQYIKAYQGDCSAVGGSDAKKPLNLNLLLNFCPQLRCSSLNPHSNYRQELRNFHNKNHTEVELLSGKTNSSFGNRGRCAVKITRPRCFSGADDECSGADDRSRSSHMWSFFTAALIAMWYAFGL
ncbi:hypothetical protein GBA52_028356 [Prunus armeniaca]|nr:hypothetical protein GBA52_028356 [Prunus armeniaca]